jgi:hypothetical protein
MRIADVFDCLV